MKCLGTTVDIVFRTKYYSFVSFAMRVKSKWTAVICDQLYCCWPNRIKTTFVQFWCLIVWRSCQKSRVFSIFIAVLVINGHSVLCNAVFLYLSICLLNMHIVYTLIVCLRLSVLRNCISWVSDTMNIPDQELRIIIIYIPFSFYSNTILVYEHND